MLCCYVVSVKNAEREASKLSSQHRACEVELTLLLLSLTAFLIGSHVCTSLYFARGMATPRKRNASEFGVSVLVPIAALTADEAMGAVDAARYLPPSSHLIYCAFDDDDPAVIIIRKQLHILGLGAHPNIQILTGRATLTRNPKLDNIEQAYAKAPTDRIICMDGNLRFGPDYVDVICTDWSPEVDLISTAPITTDEQGVWAYFEGAVLNLSHARWLKSLARLGYPFAHGKLLAFRKSWLEAQGGFAMLHTKRAEDTALVALARKARATIALTPQHQTIPLGKRSAGDVFARNLRWRFLRSRDLPFGYVAEPLSAVWFVLAIVAMLATYLHWPIGVVIVFVWFVLHMTEAWVWARVVGRWSPMMHIGIFLRDFLEPFLWILGWWLWRHRGWRDVSSANNAKPSSGSR